MTSNEERAKEICSWVLERWQLSTNNAMRVALGGLILANDTDKSLFSLIREAITLAEERGRQRGLEGGAEVAKSYLNAFDIPMQVDVKEFCQNHKDCIKEAILNLKNKKEGE